MFSFIRKFKKSQDYSLNGRDIIKANAGDVAEIPSDWAKAYFERGIAESAKVEKQISEEVEIPVKTKRGRKSKNK